MTENLDTFTQLEARWLSLPWPRAADAGDRRAILAELAAAYGAPNRRYHDLSHVLALLNLSAAYGHALENRAVVDLAIFFHDAVYDVGRRDNEDASAALARDRLTRLGFGASLVDEVARTIEATAHMAKTAGAPEGDLAWFLDFDLSILGADRTSYAAYAEAIRQEYAIYPGDAYFRGRRAALESFLARPSIFTTPELRIRWEAAARDNIIWEIGRCRTG